MTSKFGKARVWSDGFPTGDVNATGLSARLDEARRIAANIAKLLELLHDPEKVGDADNRKSRRGRDS
jgi:hypothetical protein